MACVLRRGQPFLTSLGRPKPPNLIHRPHLHPTRQLPTQAFPKRFISSSKMASSPPNPTEAAPATTTTTTTPSPTATMPPLMYGTAWKKERTADLVYEAIKAGFRGIDTAAMTKHYDEAGTGEGIRRAIREGIVSRRDLFIQTKFTPSDPSSPYPLSSPLPDQITASLLSSLTNLSTPDHHPPYLDAYLLHSPLPTPAQTLQAWSTLQSYLPSSPAPSTAGRVLALGISNVPAPSLLPPLLPDLAVVQNRFCARERGFDRQVRAWCAQHGVGYQGFWTLTGNPGVWDAARGGAKGFVEAVAQGAGVTAAEAWYVLMMEAGVVVLDGTTDQGRMRGDLEARRKVGVWRGTVEGGKVWEGCWRGFLEFVGQE